MIQDSMEGLLELCVEKEKVLRKIEEIFQHKTNQNQRVKKMN